MDKKLTSKCLCNFNLSNMLTLKECFFHKSKFYHKFSIIHNNVAIWWPLQGFHIKNKNKIKKTLIYEEQIALLPYKRLSRLLKKILENFRKDIYKSILGISNKHYAGRNIFFERSFRYIFRRIHKTTTKLTHYYKFT